MTRSAPRPRRGPAPVPLLGWLAALLAMPLAALAQARSVLPERLGGAIGDPGSAFESLPQLPPAPPPSRKFTLPPAPPPIKPPTVDGPRVLVRQVRVLGNT